MFRKLVVAAAALILPSVASADSTFHDKTVVVPPQISPADPTVRAAPLAGATLFLNRCIGGCTVKPGQDSAPDDTSQIVSQASTLPEYTFTGTQWADVLKCVQEVYSPFDVKVVDTRPTGIYQMIYVAGHPQDLGLEAGVGGVSPVTGDCSPIQGGVAFAFAYNAQDFANEDAGNFTWGLCWIIAQETAHTFGLDHEYEFVSSKRSACNDPMTYRADCGGQKFFRNLDASCGEFGPARPGCGPANTCSTTQNSHSKLMTVLGPGTVITAKPVITLEVPMANATVKAGAPVIGRGSAQRGINKVELWINGYNWGNVEGAAFGNSGQPTTPYTLTIPAGVPDSKLDITLKAFDDINIEGDSPTITVTKGKAGGCVASVVNADGTIDTCLAGQACTDGKCAWSDANTGEFGAACTYPQFCKSGECQGTDTAKICTHDCDVSITDSCPAMFECTSTGNGDNGICYTPSAGGGCCSVGDETTGSIAAHGGIAFATLGLLFGVRRKRRK